MIGFCNISFGLSKESSRAIDSLGEGKLKIKLLIGMDKYCSRFPQKLAKAAQEPNNFLEILIWLPWRKREELNCKVTYSIASRKLL